MDKYSEIVIVQRKEINKKKIIPIPILPPNSFDEREIAKTRQSSSDGTTFYVVIPE